MNKKTLKETEPSEHKQQVSVFRFARQMAVNHSELLLLNGSMNGVRLQIGQAVKAKKAGMKRGFPDIFLPVARGGYHGLFIELKRQHSGVVTPEQKKWIKELNNQGYSACVCKGAEAAKQVIMEYILDR